MKITNSVSRIDLKFSDFESTLKDDVTSKGEAIAILIGEDDQSHLITKHNDNFIGAVVDGFDDGIQLLCEVLGGGYHIQMLDTKDTSEMLNDIKIGEYKFTIRITANVH